MRAFAKINLGLRVLGVRADRYHELRTVFQTVSLCDTLQVTRKRGPSRVTLECNIGEIPDLQNLAWRASTAMVEHLKASGSFHIVLRKNVPMGAGMGGGSSDAAAAMRAVVVLTRKRVDRAAMLEIAGKLGADVPFFLLGGTALGFGRGTEIYALPEVPRQWMVVAHPGVHVNTAQAYGMLDEKAKAQSLTESSEQDRIYSFCAGLLAPQAGLAGSGLVNDFEPVVFATYPQIARLKKQLMRLGATSALLSGSGSAVYGLCGSRQKAEKIARELRASFPKYGVWVVRTVGASESLRARSW